MSTVVVDVGLGNLRSVEKALTAAAAEAGVPTAVVRTRDPSVVAKADRLVVPGQGGFGELARALRGGLDEAITERIRAGTPYLGICLGLQILLGSSEEAPDQRGLGVFDGEVVRLVGGPGSKVPHMGWNQLECAGGGHPVLDAAGGHGTWFYFVHSFHAVPASGELVRGVVRHGSETVTAALARDNVLATQFHPEKSQAAGLRLLGGFLLT